MLTNNPWVTYLSLVTLLLTANDLLVDFSFYHHDLAARISPWKSPAATVANFQFQQVKPEAGILEKRANSRSDRLF